MHLTWSVVLAAGRGARLSSVTGGVPKQYFAPTGTRSLLEDTVARLAPLVDAAHIVTIVDNSHHRYVEPLRQRAPLGEIVYQPSDRGTAVGILLAATTVWTCDPEAVLVLTPSDHGVRDVDEFRQGVERATTHVNAHGDDVVLLGVEPDAAADDYGWMVVHPTAGATTLTVDSFVEKPQRATAERLLAEGAVWNTMVMVARVEALLDLYRRHAPDIVGAFESFRFLAPSRREQEVRRLYEHLPTVDFSHHVLERAQGLQCVTWQSSVGWSDLGTPERLSSWLARPREAADGPAQGLTLH
jgi:mannose-1-phosphate guanylyltransferase